MIKAIYRKIFSEKKRIEIRLQWAKITFDFYSGNKFSCNCCGRTFRKFKSKGTLKIRKNAECPFCGSLERTRTLLFYLQRETDIFRKKTTLLHFAPEWCLIPIFKKSKICSH